VQDGEGYGSAILLRTYQGLSVRDSGVLEDDACLGADPTDLIKAGLVVRKRIDNLEVLALTSEGKRRARDLAARHAEASREQLKAFLQTKPPRIVTFLIDSYFRVTPSYLGGAPHNYGTDWTEAFIKHPLVWGVRTDILQELERLGMCCQVRYYVRVHGGETREYRYGLPTESLAILQQLSPRQPLHPEEFRVAQLYYLALRASDLFSYATPETNRLLASHFWMEVAGLDGLVLDWLPKFLELANIEGLSTRFDASRRDVPPFKVTNRAAFRQFAEERIARPLMASLLGIEDHTGLPNRILQLSGEETKRRRTVQRAAEMTSELADERERVELFRRLSVFETRLRSFLVWQLRSSVGKAYMEKLPVELVDSWEQRRQEDFRERRHSESELINYADFSDYLTIIEKFWDETFRNLFRDRELVRREFTQLNNLGRKPLAHSRVLFKDEVWACHLAIRLLSSALDEAERTG